MKRTIIIYVLIILTTAALAQNAQFYNNESGETHLCGPFQIQVLESDSIYQKWYNKGYNQFNIKSQKPAWAKELKDVEVKVFLGTWCGDSKQWVPQFVKLWDQLGLDRKNLQFIALYDMDKEVARYKQGPSGEERGHGVHRVPTFIFSKSDQEIARIVESPVSDLETDVAQIALGFPSRPNYRGASYLIDLFNSTDISEIKEKEMEHVRSVYSLIKGNPSELNTLGYVLLESGRIKEALITLYFNTRYFQHYPNVYDSYGEALAKDGQTKLAIEMYEKVLLLDRSNPNAIEQIKILKEK